MINYFYSVVENIFLNAQQPEKLKERGKKLDSLTTQSEQLKQTTLVYKTI